MAFVYKPTYPKLLPANAVIVERRDDSGIMRPFVRMTERGRAVFYKLSKDGTKYLKPVSKWYIRLSSESKPIPGFKDKGATEQRAAELERRASRESVGLTDPAEEHLKRPLLLHLEDFERSMLADGCTNEYAALATSRCTAMLEGCKFARVADISASRLAEWLAEQRTLPVTKGASRGKRSGGLSIQTSNHYLTSMKSFLNWMVSDRRIPSNPIKHLHGGNVKLDRRHDRRELTADELTRLLTVARDNASVIKGLNGEQRYLLYATAAGTGFRASELASLTPAHFNLNDGSPVVALRAEDAKNRTAASQPIPQDLADELRSFVAKIRADEFLWPGTWASSKKAAYILRHDLKPAGIAYSIDGPTGTLYADFRAQAYVYHFVGPWRGLITNGSSNGPPFYTHADGQLFASATQ